MQIMIARSKRTTGIVLGALVGLHGQSNADDAAAEAHSAIGIVEDQVVRVDPDGSRTVLYRLPIKDNFDAFDKKYGTRRVVPEYGALLVSEASGRWILPERDGAGWSLVLGDATGHLDRAVGDPSCRYDPKVSDCRPHAKAFSPDGAYVFVESQRLGSARLFRFRADGSEGTEIAGPAQANELTLDFARGRAIYQSKQGIHVAPWRVTDRRIAKVKPILSVPLTGTSVGDGPTVVGDDIYFHDATGAWFVHTLGRGTKRRVPGLAGFSRAMQGSILSLTENPVRELTPTTIAPTSAPLIVTYAIRQGRGTETSDAGASILALDDISDSGRLALVSHYGSNDLYVFDPVSRTEHVFLRGFGNPFGSSQDPTADVCFAAGGSGGNAQARWPNEQCGHLAQFVRTPPLSRRAPSE